MIPDTSDKSFLRDFFAKKSLLTLTFFVPCGIQGVGAGLAQG